MDWYVVCQEISSRKKVGKVVLTFFIFWNGGELIKFNRKLPLDSMACLQHNGSVRFKIKILKK